ncbi:MAG: hypothetical protein ACYTEQ_03610 [Planctomycetota bacterium]|jgi:hypothetical protein
MKITIAIFLSFLLCSSVFAGWKDWTPQQRAAIKAKIEELKAAHPKWGTTDLRRKINTGDIIGWNDWDEVKNRDPLVVLYEKEAKRIAQLPGVGILKTDTPAEMDAKLKAYITAAATADKPMAVYNASKFWIAYTVVQKVDGSGDPTYTIHHHDPIYAPSFAQQNNLGYVKGDDIEAAERDN